jgi:hypothetical protein
VPALRRVALRSSFLSWRRTVGQLWHMRGCHSSWLDSLELTLVAGMSILPKLRSPLSNNRS